MQSSLKILKRLRESTFTKCPLFSALPQRLFPFKSSPTWAAFPSHARISEKQTSSTPGQSLSELFRVDAWHLQSQDESPPYGTEDIIYIILLRNSVYGCGVVLFTTTMGVKNKFVVTNGLIEHAAINSQQTVRVTNAKGRRIH